MLTEQLHKHTNASGSSMNIEAAGLTANIQANIVCDAWSRGSQASWFIVSHSL